jgi:hypothetical protein
LLGQAGREKGEQVIGEQVKKDGRRQKVEFRMQK